MFPQKYSTHIITGLQPSLLINYVPIFPPEEVPNILPQNLVSIANPYGGLSIIILIQLILLFRINPLLIRNKSLLLHLKVCYILLLYIYVRISYSRSTIRYSLEKTPDDIFCVNSFSLFFPTLIFELKIKNHHCDPNSHQNNLITFISILNINTSLT